MEKKYDGYKDKLIEEINEAMGGLYVTFRSSIIDDLEAIYINEIGEDKLKKLQKYYGLDD